LFDLPLSCFFHGHWQVPGMDGFVPPPKDRPWAIPNQSSYKGAYSEPGCLMLRHDDQGAAV